MVCRVGCSAVPLASAHQMTSAQLLPLRLWQQKYLQTLPNVPEERGAKLSPVEKNHFNWMRPSTCFTMKRTQKAGLCPGCPAEWRLFAHRGMTSDLGESDKKHFLALLSPTLQYNTLSEILLFSVLGHRAPKCKTKNSMEMTHRFFSVTTGELLEVSAWPLLNSVCGLLLWSMGAPQNGQKTNKKQTKNLEIYG